ncbi:MAG: AraC family transcriptional regulator [Fibrobacterales bacterium]
MFKLPEYFNPPSFGTLELEGCTVVQYRRTDAPFKATFDISLSCYLFCIIQEGEKVITLQDTTIRAKAGDAFFLNRGVYGMAEVLNNTQHFSSLVFFIQPHFINNFIEQLKNKTNVKDVQEPRSGFKINVTPALQGFLHSILPYLNQPDMDVSAVLPFKITELLHTLCSDTTNPDFVKLLLTTRENKGFNIRDIMEKHYHSDLQIADYAKLSGKSLTSFKLEFKEIYDQPPGEWLRMKRLHKARSLIVNSEKNISEICTAVGYRNLSNFIARFKDEFGITPKQMAKNGIF